MGGVLAGTVGAGVAVELQAGLTLAAAGLIAINPVFDARAQTHATSVRAAMRDGTRALVRHRLLRDISIASMLGSLSWSLMSVGFPLYAMRELHAGAHAGGYLWAAVAIGSILGTFVLEGAPTPRRVAVSYGVLGLSALLWPLAGTLAIGFALITLTGFLEGPAYSGTVALRQRHVPPTVRAQAFNTLNSLGGIAVALGAAAGGLLHRPLTTVIAFAAVNAVAAAIALHAAGTVRIPDTRAHG
jgi:MFS family permease